MNQPHSVCSSPCLCALAPLRLSASLFTTDRSLLGFDPSDKEEAVLIGILNGDEAAAPTFFDRWFHFDILTEKVFVVLVDVVNAQEEVCATSPPQHCFQILREGDLQVSGTQRSHRRFAGGII